MSAAFSAGGGGGVPNGLSAAGLSLAGSPGGNLQSLGSATLGIGAALQGTAGSFGSAVGSVAEAGRTLVSGRGFDSKECAWTKIVLLFFSLVLIIFDKNRS